MSFEPLRYETGSKADETRVQAMSFGVSFPGPGSKTKWRGVWVAAVALLSLAGCVSVGPDSTLPPLGCPRVRFSASQRLTPSMVDRQRKTSPKLIPRGGIHSTIRFCRR